MEKVLVLGSGGFIGSHMVNRIKSSSENTFVVGVDLQQSKYLKCNADKFIVGDLTIPDFTQQILDDNFDKIYQFASDVGGAGYISSDQNDGFIKWNNTQINLNILNSLKIRQFFQTRIFFSSSSCVYPLNTFHQKEDSAYPANPENEYGWEKLYSERIYDSYSKNYSLTTRIARYYNIYGPYSIYDGGKEKSIFALCRKIALCKNGESIDVWGNGEQKRDFVFIDDCIKMSELIMNSEHSTPFNVGTGQSISINEIIEIISNVAGKKIHCNYIEGPTGSYDRHSNCDLFNKHFEYKNFTSIEKGIEKTYNWIFKEINNC
jgi:GDP-D-mannose 3',5'-epimerase